ncbi:MAG: B12-binding domain-containing radical SAM protein [Anaerolineae bacterium]
MFNRVLLIAPPSSSYLGAVRPPSNLGYLAQALLEADIEYAVEDLRASRHLNGLSKRLRAFQPDLIGISIVSLEYKRAYDVARYVKEHCPQAAVVVGGPHVSAVKATVLEECPEIDFAIIQEGEGSLVQLCQGATSFADIPGLLYRSNGAVLSGPEPHSPKDLDNISFPRYIDFNLKSYGGEIPLITSRGCPYRCIFCFHSVLGHAYRARNATSVVDEIEHWYTRGFKQFVIDDDNFTLIKKRVYEICDEIERRGINDLFIRCANGIRADRTDRDLLRRMHQVGVREVGFGADGGNDHVLLNIVKKGETLATIERAIQDALAAGIEVRLFIILGHPGETMSDIEDSFALAQRYPLIRLHLNNPIPYPGTELFEWVKETGRFIRQPEDYLNNVSDNHNEPVFDTPELPADVRREINKRARKVQRQVWREATERMLDRQPALLRTVAARLFATDLGEWLYFKNMFSRSIINAIWYRRMVRS